MVHAILWCVCAYLRYIYYNYSKLAAISELHNMHIRPTCIDDSYNNDQSALYTRGD